MRKPVVLITGAGGEIGHGLIARITESGRQSVVTLDLNPLEPALARMVQREFTGSILDTPLLERILAEFEVDTVFHLAALLSTRSEFTPTTAHQVNVEGTLHLLEFSQREAESHGRPVVFVYPSSIAAYGLPDLDDQGPGRQGHRGRVRDADDDVRLQQALLRAARPLLRPSLQAALGRAAGRPGGLPLRAFPGTHQRDDRAVGRHERLRAGDDPRGGEGRAVCVLRPSGHADPLHGDAGRRRRRC